MHNSHAFLLCRLLLSCFISICLPAQNQAQPAVSDSLYKIANTKTVSSHFALLYYKSTIEADKYAAAQDAAAKNFLTAFENSFAGYFFAASKNAAQPAALSFSWQRYYSRKDLNALQYYFVGMNAHINGDMWQALVNTHPYDSIKKYRQLLESFQHPLSVLFDSTYTACREFKKLNGFHRLTLGLDKWYGKKMLLHWRKNQIQLALLYYNNEIRFNRRLQQTHHKMKRLDKFVMRRFSS